MKVMMIICCTVPASISTIRGCWLIDVLVFQRQKLIFRSNGLSWATSGGVTADACSASFLSLSHSLVTRAFHANREDRIFWICVDLLKFLSSSELSCQSFCILSDICTFEPLLSKCTANLQALVWKLCALLFLIQHLPSGRASFRNSWWYFLIIQSFLKSHTGHLFPFSRSFSVCYLRTFPSVSDPGEKPRQLFSFPNISFSLLRIVFLQEIHFVPIIHLEKLSWWRHVNTISLYK